MTRPVDIDPAQNGKALDHAVKALDHTDRVGFRMVGVKARQPPGR
jgi:hypothetical protein